MKVPKSSVKVKENSIVSLNGYFYAIVEDKRAKYKGKFVKSKCVRFDDTFGGTEEVSSDEYQEVAEKYAKLFRD